MKRFLVVLASALVLAGVAWAQQAVSPAEIAKAEATLPPPSGHRVVRPAPRRAPSSSPAPVRIAAHPPVADAPAAAVAVASVATPPAP
ncbi:MAG: hypothetical protein WBQ17_10650, partial [Rhizomicrobium sp.]